MAHREVRGGSTRLSWDLPKAIHGQVQAKKGSLTIPFPKDSAEVERVDAFLRGCKHAITSAEARAWYFGEPDEEEPTAEPQILDSASPTLQEWVPRWVSLKTNEIQDDTLETYESQLEVVLATTLQRHEISLADVRLDQITGEHIKDLFDTLKTTRTGRDKSRPIANTTIDRYYACLHHVWETAKKHVPGVTHNPVDASGWTKKKAEADYEGEDDKADQYFETWQYLRLLELIRPDFQLFVRFMCETGVRFSEATALQIGDLDFTINKAHIKRAWKIHSRSKSSGAEDDLAPARGRGRPGTTKGKRRRWVEVTPDLMEALLPHIKGRPDTDWVFTAPGGGHIRHSNFRNRQWLPAMIKAQQCPRHLPTRIDGRNGLEVYDPHSPSDCSCLGDLAWTRFTPHALRHTYATWCILDPTTSIKLLSEQLGHKDTRTTENTYIHIRTKVAELGTAAAISRRLGHTIEGRLQPRHLHAV